MSVKKLMIIPAVAGILAGGTITLNNAYAEGKCTAHKPVVNVGAWVEGFTKVTGAAIGATAGHALTWWTINPVAKIIGIGSGAVFGWEVGSNIGGKLGRAANADELCTNNGYCLQCDIDEGGGNHECENQTVVTNGAKAYKCKADRNMFHSDKWEDYQIPVCSDSPVKSGYKGKSKQFKIALKDNYTNNGGYTPNMPGVLRFTQNVCYYITEIEDTSDKCVDDQGKRTIVAGTIKDPITCENPFGSTVLKEHATRCKAKCGGQTPGVWKVGVAECEKGYHLDGHLGDGIYQQCKKGSGGTDLTCRQKRANGTPTGLACCDTGADADYIAATDQCVCKDTTKEFKINEAGRGYCVAKGTEAPEAKCECSITAKAIAEAKATCGGKTSSAVAKAITSIELECKDIAKCDAKKFAEYMDIIDGAGASCVAPVNDEAALKRIEEKVKSVEKRFGDLDVSVWTTAEGNFNGARLASDSIAGVVLGTTGALITSSVVKKNQIKSGFEDIVCTVGGQTVGNYGDEITVGIK